MSRESIKVHRITPYKYWFEVDGKRFELVDNTKKDKYFYRKQILMDISDRLGGFIIGLGVIILLFLLGRCLILSELEIDDLWSIKTYAVLGLVGIWIITAGLAYINRSED